MTETISNCLTQKGIANNLNITRSNRLYEGFWAYLKLLLFGFKQASGNVNIVVGRLALSAILRNWFNSNKTIVVMHYYDDRDGKSTLLKWYYKALFATIKKSPNNKVLLVTVAQYWQNYFKQNGLTNCMVFYNFFEPTLYKAIIGSNKKKQIHLGQYSWKNDLTIKKLAAQLHQHGYYCYFSTNQPLDVQYKTTEFDVVYEDFNAYLKRMAESLYTLALTQINEGWNRVAHESMLVGTPVIGYHNGGLGELLKGSNAFLVNNYQEAFSIIINNESKAINHDFLNEFSAANAHGIAKPIVDWITNYGLLKKSEMR